VEDLAARAAAAPDQDMRAASRYDWWKKGAWRRSRGNPSGRRSWPGA
jgi:hypothetical protein